MVEKGIYHILGDTLPIQIILANQLASPENRWLKNLTNDITDVSEAIELAKSYDHQKKNTLYEYAMNVIVNANKGIFKEANTVCQALEELLKDTIDEKVRIAEKNAIERGEKIGMERGMERGLSRVNQLNQLLSKAGRLDDIIKAATNRDYQLALFKEYSI